MSQFNDLYNSFMLDFTPQRKHIYEHILIEENQFLKNPNGIFQKIYKIILNIYEKKQYSKEIKIYIKDIINSAFEVELKDSVKSLYLELQQLFTKNSTNYISISIEDSAIAINENSIKGSFTINPFFGLDRNMFDFRHIKVLDDIKSPIIKSLVKKQINDKIDVKTKNYKILEQNIQSFKKDITAVQELAKLVIYPNACTLNKNNLDLPTLEEAVEHEVQHLCIFLLSIAKTCVWFGKHFSNVNWTVQYELSEHEFITLLGSYSNILIRIYKSMFGNDKSKLNEFIHCLLNLSLFDKDNNSNFSEMLKQSKMFSNIKKFLKSIYDDKTFVIKNQNTEEQYTQIYENKKKIKLMFKWLYKNLEEGI